MKQSVQSLAIALLIAVLAVLSQTGCKENTIANSKLAPNIDNINTFGDTLKVITNTYLDDSLQTSLTIGGIPVNHALGVINADPYFGTTNAAMYFQVIPTNGGANVNLASAGYIFDSAVLILPYSGFRWGDTITPSMQTFTAYMLADTMSTTTPYYSYSSKAIGAALGSATVNVNALEDSVFTGGANVAPHLRIHLDSTLIAQYLINNVNVQNAASFAAFLSAFPGICVKAANPNQTSHVLPYFRLDQSDAGIYAAAGIAIYAHQPPAAGVPVYDSVPLTSLSFDETYCAHFNSIYRNYRNYPVNALFQAYQQHPNVSNPVIALQNQPGAALDLKIYGVKAIPTAVVNNAELDITVVSTGNQTADNMFFQPSQLYPLGIDSNGLEYTIADRYPLTSTSPLGVLDGYPHAFSYTIGGMVNVTTYTINMPRELQAAIIAQRDTIHLHINGTQDYYGAYRMVAGGDPTSTSSFDSRYDVNLKVVYSKLKN